MDIHPNSAIPENGMTWVSTNLIFGATIAISAFLLFQIEPMISKYILPWFGGGPAVWTAAMLFFQLLLLGGYAYAHFTTQWLKPRKQALLHLVLLAAALALLPITPSSTWKPHGDENPVLRILALLTVSPRSGPRRSYRFCWCYW